MAGLACAYTRRLGGFLSGALQSMSRRGYKTEIRTKNLSDFPAPVSFSKMTKSDQYTSLSWSLVVPGSSFGLPCQRVNATHAVDDLTLDLL
jgi:hypothetical protein